MPDQDCNSTARTQAIQHAGPFLDPPALEASVLPALSSMSSDDDPDVKYFASKALHKCMEVAG